MALILMKTTVVVVGNSMAVSVSQLASWCRYVYHMDTDTWSFCDPIAWGLTKGLDETSDKAPLCHAAEPCWNGQIQQQHCLTEYVICS